MKRKRDIVAVYDDRFDILRVCDRSRSVKESLEMNEDVWVFLDKKDSPIGIEIEYVIDFFSAAGHKQEEVIKILRNLDSAELEMKKYRNMVFLVLNIKAKNNRYLREKILLSGMYEGPELAQA